MDAAKKVTMEKNTSDVTQISMTKPQCANVSLSANTRSCLLPNYRPKQGWCSHLRLLTCIVVA